MQTAVEEGPERPFFEEGQRFSPWIRATVLVPVFALGCPAFLMWFRGDGAPGLVPVLFTVLALVALVGAALTFVMKLDTRLDSSHLRLWIRPRRWSLLPRRMTRKDIALGEISRWQVRTYNALSGTEYWGWHVWGLGVARGGRFLYMMRPDNPVKGRGVQLQLASGERVLVGSERPEELEHAITTAKNASR
jgi:hypothetical protein